MLSTVAGASLLLIGTALLVDAASAVGRRLYPDDRVAMVAAAAILFPAGVVLVLEVIGTASLLTPWGQLFATFLIWLGVRLRLRPSLEFGHRHQWQGRRPGGIAEWLVAISAAGLVVLLLAALVDGLWHPRSEFDALGYHLPIAVQWLQAGNLRLLPFTLPGYHQMQFPANAELMSLWVLLPLHRDFLVALACLPGLVLTATGTVLLGGARGGRLRTSIAVALVVVTLPDVLVSQIGTNLSDLFMLGALTASAGFLARYTASRQRRDVVLAGLAGGLAVGSRYQALIDVIPLVLIALVVIGSVERAPRAIARAIGCALLPLLGAGAYFYVRNASATSNPLYPSGWSVPLHRFPGANQACCATPSWLDLGWHPALWSRSIRQILFSVDTSEVQHSWGPVLLVFLLAGLLLPIVGMVRHRNRTAIDWMWALYPAAAIVCYLATPNSAGYGGSFASTNARYLLVPLTASAALASAEAASWQPRTRRTACALLLLVALVSDCVLSNGITQPPLPSAPAFLVVFVPLLLLIVRWRPSLSIGTRPVAVASVLAALIAVAIAAPLQAHYARNRATLTLSDLADRVRPSIRTVDLVGVCGIYPFYGPDLTRRVVVLGGDGLDPPFGTTYAAWLRELARAHVSAVVVTRRTEACVPRLLTQYTWIAEHPAAFHLDYHDRVGAIFTVGI